MTYQEAESFLFNELQSFQAKGRVAFNGNLDNAIALAEILDNPHHKFKSIHVAGTNGKGSVSHMIAAGLQANGYKVGLYTSPHYKTYRERIKINGEFIAEDNVAHFIEKYKEDIIRIKPSFFEITCAMAFDYFAKREVDVAIIEVGLGGRLDSTNIINPLISVITNISFDHQSILGDTIEKIAGEKAGIIKPNTPVIIGEKQDKTTEVFLSKSKAEDAPIYFAEEDFTSISLNHNNSIIQYFEINSEDRKVQYKSNISGPYQLKNLRTALYTLFHLRDHFNIDISMIEYGFEHIHSLTYYIGRWTTVQFEPTVIFDSAHNTAGVKYLVEKLQKMECKNLRIVWGTTREKDIDDILAMLPKEAEYYFTQADNSRAMDGVLLKAKAANFGLNGNTFDKVEEAYQTALKDAHKDDLILVAGSSFVVAEVI